MCNRYQLRVSLQQVRQTFGVTQEQFEQALPAEFFPGKTVPVVQAAETGRTLVGMTWGIALGQHRVSNSRDDKVATTWKRFMGRRVVFPLSAAVEWRYPLDLLGEPRGKPVPWVMYPADESLTAVAGISDGSGCSMMTCRANGLAAEVHNKNPADPRMVVFLTSPEEVERWLNPAASTDGLLDLLCPPPAGWLAGEAMS